MVLTTNRDESLSAMLRNVVKKQQKPRSFPTTYYTVTQLINPNDAYFSKFHPVITPPKLGRKYYSNKIRKYERERLNQWHHEFLLSKLDVAIALKDRSMIKSMMNPLNMQLWVLCGFNLEMLKNLPDADKKTLSACLEQIVCNIKTIADIKKRNLGNDIAAISIENYGVGFYHTTV